MSDQISHMREIKFRAWDGERMRDAVDLLYLDGELEAIGGYTCQSSDSYFRHTVVDGNPVAMQYTGLKDKNGVEIYEGDIVLRKGDCDDDDSILPVEWSDASGGFCRSFTDIDNKRYGIGLGASDVRTLEVIGNIYENPEPLEAK